MGPLLLCVVLGLAAQSQMTSGATLADRLNCGVGDPVPTTRVDTTTRLAGVRSRLAALNIQAMIVGSGDAHNSEYPTAYDQRRGYISGFTGSAGTVVITATTAALWTDGRYFTEAEAVLDCNWILMKEGLTDTPIIASWINEQMAGNNLNVGVDQKLVTHTYFTDMQEKLAAETKSPNLITIGNNANPIDQQWDFTPGRPAMANGSINALPLQFAGVTWQQKVADLRNSTADRGASTFVVTALDEVAWLFNLRGSDIDYNPFFLSYAIVDATTIRLYIRESLKRLQENATLAETTDTLATHLNTGATGSCAGIVGLCVDVYEYNQAAVELRVNDIARTAKVWLTYDANYAIWAQAQTNLLVDKSPIALTKSMKNSVEQQGMQNSYNRDSAALVKFLAFLEREIANGAAWTEVSVAEEMDNRRSMLQYAQGLSFETISSYGSNGAIIHYSPSNATNKKIGTDSLFLLDSGGQYLDGTTDVTRTMHYGSPTAYQKECYTRVLMGAINLAMLKWPFGLFGREIDALARFQLWEAGLVYRHGTGHGIGAYLSVHEGPGRISLTHALNPSDEPLSQNQYYSDEPGYYEENSFGIRLETIVKISSFTPKYTTANQPFLKFDPVTFVPFEPKLMDVTMMTGNQITWLNTYNTLTRSAIRPMLSNDQLATDWLDARTANINPAAGTGGLSLTCGTSGLTGWPVAVMLVAVAGVWLSRA